jgi:anti-sigma factor (TIGR02949 family)
MSDHNHTHITCDQLLGMLSDYLDGQTQDEIRREIETHMTGCQNCRVVVDTTRKTITLVHACNDKPLPIPEDVRERLYKRLDLGDYLQHPPDA